MESIGEGEEKIVYIRKHKSNLILIASNTMNILKYYGLFTHWKALLTSLCKSTRESWHNKYHLYYKHYQGYQIVDEKTAKDILLSRSSASQSSDPRAPYKYFKGSGLFLDINIKDLITKEGFSDQKSSENSDVLKENMYRLKYQVLKDLRIEIPDDSNFHLESTLSQILNLAPYEIDEITILNKSSVFLPYRALDFAVGLISSSITQQIYLDKVEFRDNIFSQFLKYCSKVDSIMLQNCVIEIDDDFRMDYETVYTTKVFTYVPDITVSNQELHNVSSILLAE